VCVRVACDYV